MFKKKSEFTRNILTLMTGTGLAELIPIIISPILTRIYSPEDFGIFAFYMSIVSIISIFSTGKYELAILLPTRDKNAFHLVVLCFVIALGVSLVSFLIIYIFNNQINLLINNANMSNWLYLLPFSILLFGVYQSLNYWNNRKKMYKQLAFNRITQSTTTTVSNLSLAQYMQGAGGLIIGSLLGQGVASIMLMRKIVIEDRSMLKQLKIYKLFILAKTYKKFPQFDLLSSLLNVSSHQLPHMLLNIIFNTTIGGYYYLAQRTVGLPVTLVSSAVADVFKVEATQEYKKNKNTRNIFMKTAKKLFLLGLIPSFFLYYFTVDVFSIVFGEKWYVAGEYAKVLVPMLFLRFVISPLSFVLYISQKQSLNLIGQVMFFISMLGSFYFGETAMDIVILISTSFSVVYVYYFYISAKIAKVF